MSDSYFKRWVHANDELAIERAKLELARASELEVEKEKLELRKRTQPIVRPQRRPAHAPIVWTGTARELAFVVAHTKANAQKPEDKYSMDACKQVCRHFLNKKGKPISPRVLWQNMKGMRDKESLGKVPPT